MPITADTVRQFNDVILAQSFHRMCDYNILRQEPGKAVCTFAVNDFTANISHVLHGGILYALLDVSAFIALSTLLEPGERAVSHDVHVSILKPVSKGKTVEIRSEVQRRGRSLSFIRSEAFVDGSLIGMGTITKSMIPPAP